MPRARIVFATILTNSIICPRAFRFLSVLPRRVSVRNMATTNSDNSDNKVKGPKGGSKAPIFEIPEKDRLFTAEEGLLLKDVVCFSLYHFSPVKNPDTAAKAFDSFLKGESLKKFAGTCYIANEGMNSQYSVATSYMSEFETQLKVAVDEVFGLDIGELDINTSEILKKGTQAPFKRFRVVARPQILTDGLKEELVWSEPGPEIEPEVWHNEIVNAEKKPLILDCRNDYESDVGAFAGAVPLNTKTFQETWNVLDKMLENKPKDEPVYMYCTGGIRCVKVGAYVTQKQGFSDVRRLKHGTIGYERWAKRPREDKDEKDEGSPPVSIFKGSNFIFDQREQDSNSDSEQTSSKKIAIEK